MKLFNKPKNEAPKSAYANVPLGGRKPSITIDSSDKKTDSNRKIDKKKPAAVGAAALLLLLLSSLARFGLGLSGGGGAAPPGANNALLTGSSQAVEAPLRAEPETTAPSGTTSADPQGTSAAETAENAGPSNEYVIEVRQGSLFLDGAEISFEEVAELLSEEGASFRIDNNYGSQKTVSELRQLFLDRGVPYVE
jgi:hypothetical protein